jgi:tRNA A37 threonylcarbamoyladenosine modification protein TsaB
MGGDVTVRSEEHSRFSAPAALDLLTDTLRESDCAPARITEIRIGRGPGNYTGIRQSIAVAIGLSLPESTPILAVNSGTLISAPADAAAGYWVLGDARRGLWWGGRFPVSGLPEWTLKTPEAWMKDLQRDVVLSSEADRLHGLKVQQGFPSVQVLLDLRDSQLTEAAEPLYLHQAV